MTGFLLLLATVAGVAAVIGWSEWNAKRDRDQLTVEDKAKLDEMQAQLRIAAGRTAELMAQAKRERQSSGSEAA